MRLQSAINVFEVNLVFFVLLQIHGVLGSPSGPHTAADIALDVIVFTLGGFLLPSWILYFYELQARQRFLANYQDLNYRDLGRYWEEHLLCASRMADQSPNTDLR